jgi:hypothetical protein
MREWTAAGASAQFAKSSRGPNGRGERPNVFIFSLFLRKMSAE